MPTTGIALRSARGLHAVQLSSRSGAPFDIRQLGSAVRWFLLIGFDEGAPACPYRGGGGGGE